MQGDGESNPIEFGCSPGDALVAGAGAAFSHFAQTVPWLINQAVDVVLIFGNSLLVLVVVASSCVVCRPHLVVLLGDWVSGVLLVTRLHSLALLGWQGVRPVWII